MTDNKDWRSLFVGRETELAWLQDAWQKARSGEPQLRVLRGESGLGKTKVVQELYAWLSRTDVADPEDYWPSHLIAGDNLRLNPDLETQVLGEDMQYLWWGLRWVDPGLRNKEELTHCAFFDQRQMLQPHWQTLESFKDTASATLKLGGEIGNIALDLAKDAAVNLFPLLGIFKTVIDVGEAVRDVGQAAGGLGDEFDRRSKSPAQREAEEQAEQIKQIVAFLGWVLKPFYRSGSGSMPVVLVLDDAQWMDERSLEVVRQLFDQALEHKWPLLVIATHWEREWHEALTTDSPSSDSETASDELGSFAAYYESLSAKGRDDCDLLDLSRLREGASVLQTAFPGLTPEQLQTLARHADGNARLLTEIILFLESAPELFISEDTSQPLDDVAIEELEMEMSGFALNKLQEKRYKRLPAEIRKVLALASLQGVRFLADLVNEQGCSAGIGAASSCAFSIGQAENPYSIISSSGLEREFRFAIFHEFSSRFFDRLCRLRKLDETEVRESLLNITAARLGSAYYARLTDSERENLLLILLQSGDDNSPEYTRALLWAMDHYVSTRDLQRMGELLGQWQERVGDRVLPFNTTYTEPAVERTPFYNGWMVFGLTDYDHMPARLIRYATDGSEYRLIDGSAECLLGLNESANTHIDDLNVMDYLRFYFANVCFEDGSSQMIESADVIADAEPDVHDLLTRHLRSPQITWNAADGEGRVSVLLAQRGSLFDVELNVDTTGNINFESQTCLEDSLTRFRNHHWAIDKSANDKRRGAPIALLDGAVRPAITEELSETLLEQAKGILMLSEVTEEALAPWTAGEVDVRLFDSAHELAIQPRDSRTLCIGIPRYQAITLQRLTLLVGWVLLDEQLTREGFETPWLSDPKEVYTSEMATRKSKQVARLCMFAFDLSLKDELSEYDFIAEMHAMGHGEPMDIFARHVD